MAEMITVDSTINVPVEKVWNCWTKPEHVMQWNHASDDWHTPSAENDFRAGGSFSYRTEAKDGSFGFDFWGIHDEIVHLALIRSTPCDGRTMSVSFVREDGRTKVTEIFEAETQNTVELQRYGWQAILDNFKKYVELS